MLGEQGRGPGGLARIASRGFRYLNFNSPFNLNPHSPFGTALILLSKLNLDKQVLSTCFFELSVIAERKLELNVYIMFPFPIHLSLQLWEFFLSYEEKRSVCFNLRLVLLQQMPFPNVQNGQVFKPVMQGPVKQFTPGGEYCF